MRRDSCQFPSPGRPAVGPPPASRAPSVWLLRAAWPLRTDARSTHAHGRNGRALRVVIPNDGGLVAEAVLAERHFAAVAAERALRDHVGRAARQVARSTMRGRHVRVCAGALRRVLARRAEPRGERCLVAALRPDADVAHAHVVVVLGHRLHLLRREAKPAADGLGREVRRAATVICRLLLLRKRRPGSEKQMHGGTRWWSDVGLSRHVVARRARRMPSRAVGCWRVGGGRWWEARGDWWHPDYGTAQSHNRHNDGQPQPRPTSAASDHLEPRASESTSESRYERGSWAGRRGVVALRRGGRVNAGAV